jgi:hypothetical protein
VTPWGWRLRSIATWTIVSLVVICAAALYFWSTYFNAGRTVSEAVPTQRLNVGHCVQEWYAGRFLPQVVETTQCNRPHFGEVFAVLAVPETQEYPGEEALKKFGSGCDRKLSDYAPNLPDGSTFEVAVGYPKAEAWRQGHRSVICVAQSHGERWAPLRA